MVYPCPGWLCHPDFIPWLVHTCMYLILHKPCLVLVLQWTSIFLSCSCEHELMKVLLRQMKLEAKSWKTSIYSYIKAYWHAMSLIVLCWAHELAVSIRFTIVRWTRPAQAPLPSLQPHQVHCTMGTEPGRRGAPPHVRFHGEWLSSFLHLIWRWQWGNGEGVAAHCPTSLTHLVLVRESGWCVRTLISERCSSLDPPSVVYSLRSKTPLLYKANKHHLQSGLHLWKDVHWRHYTSTWNTSEGV